MRVWSCVLMLVVFGEPRLQAQALLPSRFSAALPSHTESLELPAPAPRLCSTSKVGTVVRHAGFGFALVGGMGLAYFFYRGIAKAAAFQADEVDFPILEAALGSGVIFGVLGGVEWERRCG